MVIGAIVFAGSAAALLIDPNSFLAFIGLAINDSTIWSFRLIGLLLLALATHMATTSRHAADPAFRRAASVMVLVSGGLSALTYMAPGATTTGRWIFIGVGAGFSLLYLITLPIKSIGYKEAQPHTS